VARTSICLKFNGVIDVLYNQVSTANKVM